MSSSETEVTRRKVDDMLIAGIRFRGKYAEAPEYFDRLYEQVKRYVTGKGILLHHYYDQSVGEGNDLEVCYPVSQPVGTEEVKSRILEGGEMLCTIHVGPLGGQESLKETYGNLWTHIRKNSIIPATGPVRLVYLEDEGEHEDDVAKGVMEIQLPYAFHRMERLAKNLARFAGEEVRENVMEGIEEFESSTKRERAAWFERAMERLDSLVDDEEVRCNVMISCSDRFPRARIQMLREEYERSGDLDALLEIMRADRTLGDTSWYEDPIREGNVIYVTKDPFFPEKHREATDEAEKRSYYCHCGLMRDAIREGMTMSRTYCYCGAGWYEQLWEGILGKPVRVEIVCSVLQGDDRCSFAIHLPLEEKAT